MSVNHDQLIVFDNRPATIPLPAVVDDGYRNYGSEQHCRKVRCRWPCWHHVHEYDILAKEDLKADFTCYGTSLQTFADQGCAPCALLRHHCELQIHGFCEKDRCSVNLDEYGQVTDVHFACQADAMRSHRDLQARAFVELCALTDSQAGTSPDRSALQPSKGQAVLPLRTPPGMIQKDPRSEALTDLIRGWLKDCTDNHSECRQAISGALPSRVLDVRTNRSGDMIQLRESDQLEGDYLALSYCWGGKVPPRTTKRNHRDHENGMSLSSLPATYVDAVVIARKLSIPFLRIDSLCIIQDDDDDRDFELGKMEKTFRHAALVLVAASARNPHEGFLGPRRSTDVWSEPTAVRLGGKQEQIVVSRAEQRKHNPNACSFTAVSNRAWTLQKRLLARRCLIFDGTECSWECRALCRCECQGDTGGQKPQLLKFAEQASVGADSSAPATYDLWRTIVSEHYSERQLSVAADRLPAISAIAQYIADITDDQYLAGIWRRDIVRQLAWYPYLSSTKDGKLPRVSAEYTAPSWSWASWAGEDRFLEANAENVNYNPEILAASSRSSTYNPYGAVHDAHLIMKGFTSRATLSVSHERKPRPGRADEYGFGPRVCA